ncbi:TPA: CO dehydrogenase/acetyl-CoA synthase complex subunit epsilon [Candidatus Bathyarchaeota archaeon]|nr:CO dehydrogenase/acetyl-CoA synthase complex subunit epsilon [Candidatus Bathyarchaeota archaeon]
MAASPKAHSRSNPTKQDGVCQEGLREEYEMSILPSKHLPWQIGNIPGPTMALSPDKAPKVFASLAKRAKNPLLIVGRYVVEFTLEGKSLIDFTVEIAKKGKMPIVATGNSYKGYLERKFPAVYMSLVDIVNRLQDPNFTVNPDRKPPHDLILFLGITYNIGSQGLSTLKHFAPHLKTITLCKWYHPNAAFSFPNMDDKAWRKSLEELIQALG